MFRLDAAPPLSKLLEDASRDLKKSLTAAGFARLPERLWELSGPDFPVRSLRAADEEGDSGSLTFADGERHLSRALENGSAGIIAGEGLKDSLSKGRNRTLVFTREPRLLFAAVLNLVEKELRPPPPQGEPVFKDRESVEMGQGVSIGPFTYIGAGVKIGARALIGSHVFIEDEVEIGEDTVIHPGVSLRWRVRIGSRVRIHGGSVIGGDGFGYTQAPVPETGRLLHYRNAHLGAVVVEDDVEIGTLTAVDRGLVKDTIIASGSRLDNLVQIGHNAQIGRDCVVVSQTGVAGHSKVGNRVFLLGQAGLSHGAEVGDDAIVTGQSGVTGKIPPGRRAWAGTPARPMEEQLRSQGNVRRGLPLWNMFLRLFFKAQSFGELKDAFAKEREKAGKEKKTGSLKGTPGA
ncbi:MAG: UDP-3-O-(3-hydroxymyristoyl)glucosamine N-acyltransferase [Deltaproteobacteria bacterium]|nr:UDP-3-O-(3-hydroxymyristoyl)glucosamine N-acyltransferase [Deltaproteobacteria bacterium]